MTQPTMPIPERAAAISRAKRALRAMAEHPDSSKRQLGKARERLNACYRLPDATAVMNAVEEIEKLASERYGLPTTPDADENAGHLKRRKRPGKRQATGTVPESAGGRR